MHTVKFTGTYQYTKIYNFSNFGNFLEVEFRFDLMMYILESLKILNGFNLGTIPDGVTMLRYNSDIPLHYVGLPKTLKCIKFGNHGTEIRSLPDHVKKIYIPFWFTDVSHLKGIEIVRGFSPTESNFLLGAILRK